MLTVLNYGMGLANVLFLTGFYIILFKKDWPQRKRVGLHKVFTISATSITLILGVSLIIFSQLSQSNISEPSIALNPWATPLMFWLHRVFALLAFFLMIALTYWGFTKKFHWHKKLGKIFIVLYTLVYLSGLLIF